MRPDSRLSDPEYLKRFTGEYDLAGGRSRLRVKGNTLVLEAQGRRHGSLCRTGMTDSA